MAARTKLQGCFTVDELFMSRSDCKLPGVAGAMCIFPRAFFLTTPSASERTSGPRR
jgi:hypothetical protein